MPASGLTLYRLHTPAAIGQALHDVQQQKGALSLYAQDAGVDSVQWAAHAAPFGLASVSDVDAETQTVALHLSTPILPLPQQALGVAHLPGGVRVQWVVQGEWQPIDALHWQMHTPWPTEVLQLQRRRHQRLSVPLGQNYSASFRFGRRRCELDIEDLSLGGVALRGTRQETAMLFMGRDLPKVGLYMADGTVLEAHLKVRSRRSYQSFLLGEQVLVGCSVEAMAAQDRLLLEALLGAGMQALHA